jgi:hypothetical protein
LVHHNYSTDGWSNERSGKKVRISQRKSAAPIRISRKHRVITRENRPCFHFTFSEAEQRFQISSAIMQIRRLNVVTNSTCDEWQALCLNVSRKVFENFDIWF